MRIVIDMQSLQTVGSRDRGIGRYSLALARAMIAGGSKHEWILALNHAFPETVDSVREAFADLLPEENVLLFQIPAPVAGNNPENRWRCRSAELIREHFLQQLRPDWVHISSLFEGLGDNAVTSIGNLASVPSAVTLFDLIPYVNPDLYLSDPVYKSWYMRKVAHLRRADLLLAISEYSRREAIEALGLAPERVVNISADADASFRVIDPGKQAIENLRAKYGLKREFVMYTGGIDRRKNIEPLVEAYARLPVEVRSAHQLVIVCKVRETERQRLLRLAAGFGLGADECVLTGYVSDADLVMLYNLCKLFVFPSRHEGFGLPVLEAMRCGAPVIASGRTSIPEVVGLKEALFDPCSVESIAGKLYQALIDAGFIQHLREQAKIQAGKFSWQKSGIKALAALESAHERRQANIHRNITLPASKPRLAYFSPLPPEKSGIASYSAELLPELARYYQIDLITALPETTDRHLAENFRLRPLAEFKGRAGEYERVLYHFGNSAFHSRMFPLLAQYPGTVVLHDFFLSGVLHYLEATTPGAFALRQALYRSHGYPALAHWRLKGVESAVWTYPASLEILRGAQGVIVHSEYCLQLAKRCFGWNTEGLLVRIPHMRRPAEQPGREAARRELGLPDDAFVICSFGILGPIKLNDRLLDSWLASDLARMNNCYLIFAGDGQGGEYENLLRQRIEASGIKDRIRITGYATNETYKNYLAAADVAVQLRTRSRGETSGAVLDCLSHGVPTIVNNHGAMTELPPEAVIKIPEEFTPGDLSRALERLQREPARREAVGRAALQYVRSELDPSSIGERYARAIETFAKEHPLSLRQKLLSAIRGIDGGASPTDRDLAETAAAIAENSLRPGIRKVLLDITELAQRDAKTGIQRVVRNVLRELTAEDCAALRVEPVYRSGNLYRYARSFMDKLTGMPLGLDDAPADVSAKDLFLGLDLDPGIDEAAREWLQHQARRGVRLFFVVYDLLPVLRPDCFPPGAYEMFSSWLKMVAGLADGLVCISRSVAVELGRWLDEHPVERRRPLSIGYFHLGSEVTPLPQSANLTTSEKVFLQRLEEETAVLMVGTIEPRKGHVQALNAFEALWRDGKDVLLIIAGKQGWMMEEFVERLRHHPEAERRLFWLEQVSDDFLAELYRRAAALLAASEGEGFGLPLVEAARQGLPLIARNLPVFREIAGEHAFYFAGNDAGALAQALKEWLDLFHRGRHPRSEGIRRLSWRESAGQLAQVLFEGRWFAVWEAGHGFHLTEG